jgi:hypothetical protein
MSSIALLPILSSQKSVYNFKQLSTQYSDFLKQAAKTIVSSQSFTEENIKAILIDSIQSIYGKKVKKERAKQAKSAYIFFCIDKRPEFKEANPDDDGKVITKKLSEAWHLLTDEEKEPYNQMREDDKAFVCFYAQKFDEYQELYPQEKEKGIAKKLSDAWNLLSNEEKEEYAKLKDQKKEQSSSDDSDAEEKPKKQVKKQAKKEVSDSESDAEEKPKKQVKKQVKKDVSSDSESDAEGKIKKDKKPKKDSKSSDESDAEIKIETGFDEKTVKSVISKKLVKELKTFIKHYMQDDSLPDNFEKMPKADLSQLCSDIMKNNNIKSWSI